MSNTETYDYYSPYGNAANQFGWQMDPTWDQDPYEGLGYQEDALTDIFKVAGIYPEDLLNLAPAPEAPTRQPFTSDFMQMYGNNPVIQSTAAAIAAGEDPITAAKKAVTQAKAQGMQVESTPEFLAQNAIKYVEEQQRQTREQGQYDQAASEYDRFYNPSNVLQESGLTADDLYAQVGYQGRERAQTPTGPEAAIGSAFKTAQGRANQDAWRPEESVVPATRTHYRDGEWHDATPASRVAAPVGPGRTLMSAPQADPAQLQGMRNQTTMDRNQSLFDSSIEANVDARLARMANDYVPSIQEQQNLERMKMAYSMLMGAPAPTKGRQASVTSRQELKNNKNNNTAKKAKNDAAWYAQASKNNR